MTLNVGCFQVSLEDQPKDWELKSISEVAEVVGGGTPSTKNSLYWDGPISWITPKDLSQFNFRYIEKGERSITKEGLEKSSAKILPKGAVLLSSRAPIGYLAIANNEVTTNQGFRSLIPNLETSSEFLYYLLKANVEILKSNGSGTTFSELSGGRLKELKFHFPSKLEQNAISNFLALLDQKIELNHQMNETLEQMAQAIFKSWFVDFEPFRDPEHEWYVGEDGFEYNEELEKEIPKGWEVRSMKDLSFDFIDSYRGKKYPKTNDFIQDSAYIFIDSKCVINNRIDYSQVKFIEKIKYFEIAKSGLLENDIIMTTRGTLGRVAIFDKSEYEFAGINAQMLILRITDNEKIDPILFYYFLKGDEFQNLIEQYSSGSVAKQIPITQMKTIKVLNYPIRFQNSISNIIHPLEFKIRNNNKEIRILTKIRNLLLPQLISGKLRILDPEKFLEVLDT
ncbi:MAG: restriction endonuclease subunit S [Candidatus Heimdallarchaeota archaeon]|nr:restriction endonuclease subunit S [Candidatus Heimdallarchaeota archaeon]